jgi:hypothetical protein
VCYYSAEPKTNFMKKTKKFYFYESEFPLLFKGGNRYKNELACETWKDAKHFIRVLRLWGYKVTYKTVRDEKEPYILVEGKRLPTIAGIPGRQLILFPIKRMQAS